MSHPTTPCSSVGRYQLHTILDGHLELLTGHDRDTQERPLERNVSQRESEPGTRGISYDGGRIVGRRDLHVSEWDGEADTSRLHHRLLADPRPQQPCVLAARMLVRAKHLDCRGPHASSIDRLHVHTNWKGARRDDGEPVAVTHGQQRSAIDEGRTVWSPAAWTASSHHHLFR